MVKRASIVSLIGMVKRASIVSLIGMVKPPSIVSLIGMVKPPSIVSLIGHMQLGNTDLSLIILQLGITFSNQSRTTCKHYISKLGNIRMQLGNCRSISISLQLCIIFSNQPCTTCRNLKQNQIYQLRKACGVIWTGACGNDIKYANSEGSGKPGHPRSLTTVYPVCWN